MGLETREIILKPENNKRLTSLCGPLDDNIKQLECQLGVIINRKENFFKLIGGSLSVNTAINVLISLYSDTQSKYGIVHDIAPEQVYLTIKQFQISPNASKISNIIYNTCVHIITKHKTIKPRTTNQKKYIENICKNDISFGIGPAGTGKTYLAVAIAIELLQCQKIQHIVLSRPIVEAGEKLGFLPGDLNQKIHPYMHPLYDALFDIMHREQVDQLIQKNIIEIAPLEYMRGRTFHNSVVILDEGQNTTIKQMKMFLTRIGFNSKMIITGDTTQIDLPVNQQSGLIHAVKVLSSINNISFIFFDRKDSIRHSIVTHIIEAYEQWSVKNNNLNI